jgi:hypothetical protein
MKKVKYHRLDPRNRPAARKLVPLDKVEVDRSTQMRVRKNPERVKELAGVLEAGKEFKDDPEVYFDGYKYWVGDGFHRLDAYALAGRTKVWALVREGTLRDAMIHAGGANAEHGLPRKREDLHRALRTYLEDPEIAKLSNTTIARLARCTDKPVADMKARMGLDSDKRTYTDRHGNVTEMDVSGLRDRKIALPPTNAFHDLPADARDITKKMFRVMSQVKKEQLSFWVTWLEQHMPRSPKKAAEEVTGIELEEEGARQEAGDGPGGGGGGNLPF